MTFNTQYTTLLLELEKLDHQMRWDRKEETHDTTAQTTSHRPMQLGGHGPTDVPKDGAQAA